MRKAVGVAALTGVAALIAGCSSYNTAPDQKVLHYSGGSFSSQQFKDCQDPGKHGYNGPGDHYFYYPVGQRTWEFSDSQGADTGPLTSSTKDQQELVVKGTVTFTLNTDCTAFKDASGREWKGGILQKFNDTIGRKYSAAGESGGEEPPAGWDRMLQVYLGNLVDRAVDNEALKYGWEQLYNNAESKRQWEQDVVKTIPDLVKQQAGEDYFTINNIVLQKPDISQGLKDQLVAKQAAELRGQAASIDKRNAETWPGGVAAYLAYQQQLAINKAIADGKVQVIPIPQGSGINVTLPTK